MQFVTVRTEDGTRAGRVEDDEIVLLDHADVKSVLKSQELSAGSDADAATIPLADADLAPVIPHPDKIICVGVNYRDHIEEMGGTPPDYPTYFAKYARALIGPHDDITLPDPETSTKIDWECELAVVIGSPVRHASASEALDAIAGYSILNDVSVRDWQRHTSQFIRGKTFEGLTPLGPALVTRDEIGDGSGLTISTTVDGEVKQQSNTSSLIFNVIDIVQDLSKILTLDPGDVIATGTPGGVGAGRRPQEWLTPGATMTTTIVGLGQLINRCV